MEAQCELKTAGKAYPRTCPVCKLGPCQRMETVPRRDADAMLIEAAKMVRVHVASVAAEHATHGRFGEAKAVTEEPIWKALKTIIGD
jgi:hypothetical protein